MSPGAILLIIAAYFLILLVISYITGRKADNAAFFLGNRKSPWYVVSFGMIGASLSGVTFISVPGWVVDSQFSYMQMVFGYLLGYAVIANVLMPLYYRLNLTSIYTYLESRFGFFSYKTGAAFFLLSRLIGAAVRLFLVANVLQITIFNEWNVPFIATVIITVLLIWLYTNKGGIKTIIWTDSFQTLFMLVAVGLCVYFISRSLNLDFRSLVNTVADHSLSQILFLDDWQDKRYFLKQFFSGAFITIVMTGLDQDMMQKNLSCKNINEAKKNMYWFSIILIPVNLLFMSLGVLLFIYAKSNGIALPEHTDDLFPIIATQGYLQPVVTILFILGLIAAAYSSADSALTSLTTSFTVDILNTKGLVENALKRIRKRVHILISVILVIVILIFKAINDQSVISTIFTVAGYTYGPLLGLYSFGLFTKFKVKDKLVPWVALFSPVICYILNIYSETLLGGYRFGFELLILNGLITFTGLYLIKEKRQNKR
ncbi:MAG: sodium:solute symporter [Bacteroidetes bacterium]|nr:sodium:solute symporter [Bacteroidota bacterium]